MLTLMICVQVACVSCATGMPRETAQSDAHRMVPVNVTSPLDV